MRRLLSARHAIRFRKRCSQTLTIVVILTIHSQICFDIQAVAQCSQQQKITASDAAAEDLFGSAVSVSGTTAIVGAYQDSDAGSWSGSAYVYQLDGMNWDERQKLTASDAAAGDRFGVSVAVSGDVAIIGSHRDDDDGDSSGSAYIFRFDGTNWVEEQKLTASDAVPAAQFGIAVSINGDTAIVGAYLDINEGDSTGAAYVYRFDGTSWAEVQKLTASDGGPSDWFGWSVSVSGDTAVVGANGHGENGLRKGAAYVFRFDGTGWLEEQKLFTDYNVREYGRSVSVSGNTVFVGAPFGSSNAGSAYAYRFDGTSWTEEQRLPEESSTSWFGYSVSVSADKVVIGMPGPDPYPPFNPGSRGELFIYRLDGTSWVYETRLAATDSSLGDRFGTSASISGETILVGAHMNDSAESDSGSAYVFFGTRPETCNDVDCDGFGAPGDASCPFGAMDDCNDDDASVFPGSIEIACNGEDDDCDPETLDAPDADGDGASACSDCDDDNFDIYPGNSETFCNGIDDDCDPGTSDAPSGVEIDCTANGLADECDILSGVASDADSNGVPDECEAAPLGALAPYNVSTNRYFSFQPNNVAAVVAFQVGLPDGRTGYVSEPQRLSDRGTDEQWVSNVVDAPVFRSWIGESVVHVRGCVIVPDQSYEIRTLLGQDTSLPLTVSTTPVPTLAGSWADCVGTFDSTAGKWTGPNGATNFNDIAASIDQFQQKETNPVTWTDVAGETPNYLTNFGDIASVIAAFQEVEYWFNILCCDSIDDCDIPSP